MVARRPRSRDQVLTVRREELRVPSLGLAHAPSLPFGLAHDLLEFLLRRRHGRQDDSRVGRIRGSGGVEMGLGQLLSNVKAREASILGFVGAPKPFLSLLRAVRPGGGQPHRSRWISAWVCRREHDHASQGRHQPGVRAVREKGRRAQTGVLPTPAERRQPN